MQLDHRPGDNFTVVGQWVGFVTATEVEHRTMQDRKIPRTQILRSVLDFGLLQMTNRAMTSTATDLLRDTMRSQSDNAKVTLTSVRAGSLGANGNS